VILPPGGGGALRAAVFLDRDGTVIEDRHYLGSPDGVRLLPGAAAAIARLNQAGVPVVLVSNQSGIARGFFSEDDFHAVQRRLADLLAAEGARLDAAYHCPHGPDDPAPCDCRKPATGLFLRAAREHGLDLARSWFVGDRLRDVQPGVALGGRGILLATEGVGTGLPGALSGESQILVVRTLTQAVGSVLGALAND
jgi:D-glycero-D-manno-heptose 1,7-bisphosphate phosphatase